MGLGMARSFAAASGPNFVSKCSGDRQRFFLNPDINWASLDIFMNECVAIKDENAFAAKGLSDGDSYGLSKACANSYTLFAARQHPKLRINACTPGFIEADLSRPFAEAQGKTPASMGMKPPAAMPCAVPCIATGLLVIRLTPASSKAWAFTVKGPMTVSRC